MKRTPLPNNKALLDRIKELEESVTELEMLLLEESFERDELAEEVDAQLELIKEQLKEAPKIIIQEIHHYSPAQIVPQPWNPDFPSYPIVYC